MATLNKFNCFAGDVGLKIHNLNTDTLKWMLTNTAPVATNAVKTDITEISAGNGYSAGGVAAGNAYSQSSGTGTLTGSSPTVTATGAVGPFRYAVLYNSTAASGNLIGWVDYGSSITLANTESFTISVGASILTIV